ncbi:MAG TPA: ABC transporter ATP-binding protein [Ilumatobacter sp.]|nr:ABC transporter ATP-binding protein [Ilumatobacter sp.]
MLVATGSACTLGGPLVIRELIDQVGDGAGAGDVRWLALAFLAIVAVGQALGVLVVWWATATAWGVTNRLRLELTEHVLGLDHEFHRTHTPGELISRVDGDVTSVSDFLGKVLPKVAGSLLLVLGIIGVLAVVDWRLGAAMLVYFLVAVAAVRVSRHRSVNESADEMSALGRLYGGIEERLNASEDLRANGAGGHAMWRFVEEAADYMRQSLRRAMAFMGMWWTVEAAVVLGMAGSIAGGAWLVERGSITIGTAFLLFQYVLLISKPLDEMVQELQTVQKANGAMIRVAELMDVRPTVVDAGTTSPAAGPLAVTCTGVGFDYGDRDANGDVPPVLRDVDLAIGAGRTVGVVGRTGSGKTTFTRLVLRLVEPTAGTLALGGVPIADIPMAELRRRVALVPQEVELLAGTVRDNVTLFDPSPSDADVDAALRAAGLDTLADGGLDRQLGPGGAGLSAGEAQLVSLARVWLRRPDLVVLDEATARVDPETEVRLAAAVRRLLQGRTALIIAHRLSTLQEVDDVVVFGGGRVLEFGTRAELAADPASRFHRLLSLSGTVGAESLDELDDELTGGLDALPEVLT